MGFDDRATDRKSHAHPRRQVAVIAATTTPAALAANAEGPQAGSEGRLQLIDDSVISRGQSFSRKDESVRQCVQLACTVRQLGLAYAQADRPKPFTAQRSCRRR
jgi:hypothetical protein